MSHVLMYTYLRTRIEALAAWERLWKNAQREEGQIAEYLTMGILIIIVLAIAIVLYKFRDAVNAVIKDAINALKNPPKPEK